MRRGEERRGEERVGYEERREDSIENANICER
jgi:hypothetical protein